MLSYMADETLQMWSNQGSGVRTSILSYLCEHDTNVRNLQGPKGGRELGVGVRSTFEAFTMLPLTMDPPNIHNL